MTSELTIGAALVLGLTASGHCFVMCGGISAALGVATAKRPDGKPLPSLLIGYQVGRVLSYAVAGAVFGGALGILVGWLDIDSVRRGLRGLSALALLLAALVALGAVRDPGLVVGRGPWARLAPRARRLLPVNTMARALSFGMLWGWMPCGFVYTVLLLATLQGDAAHSATTMVAFGLGTMPAMFATATAARRVVAAGASTAGRRVAGSVLLASALLTLLGPWLAAGSPWLHSYLPFDCGVGK